MIICRKIEDKVTQFYNDLTNEFNNFNERNNALRLRYVEFEIDTINNSIQFEEIVY